MEKNVKKLGLEVKLIEYMDKMIDRNMDEVSLGSDKLDLIIKYLKS